MVNKKSIRYTEKHNLENTNSILRIENNYLKTKNEDLAKALAETRLEVQTMRDNFAQIHGKLFYSDVEKINIKETLKTVSSDLQKQVAQFITFTEQMAKVLQTVNICLSRDPSDLVSNSPAQNVSNVRKVMPMVSGHTIFPNPTINLPRVNVRELSDMLNTNDEEEPDANDVDTNEMETDESILNNGEEESQSSSNLVNQLVSSRLETMQEMDEEELEEEEEEEQEEVAVQSLRSSTSLMSGVFRDVKVYVSPLARQYVIGVKNKTPLARKRASETSMRNKSTISPKFTPITPNQSSTSSSSTSTPSDDSADITIGTQAKRKKVRPLDSDASNTPNSTRQGEEDTSEGPSCSWSTSNGIALTPTDTSTPRSTIIPWQRKKQGASKTPTRSSNFVTKRRSLSKKISKASVDTNCTVILNKMSPNTIKRLTDSPVVRASRSRRRSSSGHSREDSPTVLERSRSMELPESKVKKTSDSTLPSSPNRRAKRNVKPITYKEPSLTRKLRR